MRDPVLNEQATQIVDKFVDLAESIKRLRASINDVMAQTPADLGAPEQGTPVKSEFFGPNALAMLDEWGARLANASAESGGGTPLRPTPTPPPKSQRT